MQDGAVLDEINIPFFNLFQNFLQDINSLYMYFWDLTLGDLGGVPGTPPKAFFLYFPK